MMKLELLIVTTLGCFLVADVEGINGGFQTEVGEFKYIVGLEIHPEVWKLHREDSSCTGAIIHENYILTSAHCFTENKKKNSDGSFRQKFVKTKVTIYANVIGLDKKYRKLTHQVERQAVRAYFLPKWFENGIEPDIAVVKLNSPLSFHGGLLQKLHLPERAPNNLYHDYNGAHTVLAGFGHDKVGENNNRLKKTDMRVVETDTCDFYKVVNQYLTHNKFICGRAQEVPFSGCEGDSGAPLVLKQNQVSQDKNEGKTVIAVLSRGGECRDKINYENVFVRVSHYLGFINKIIENKADQMSTIIKYDFKS